MRGVIRAKRKERETTKGTGRNEQENDNSLCDSGFGGNFRALAMLYLVFALALTLKNFGLSVEAQLIALRIITPLVFVALGALAVSCEYFRRVFYIGWLWDGARTMEMI